MSGFPGDSYAQSSPRNIPDPGRLHLTGVGTHDHRLGLGSPSGGWLSGTRKHIGPLGCGQCSPTPLGRNDLSGGPNLQLVKNHLGGCHHEIELRGSFFQKRNPSIRLQSGEGVQAAPDASLGAMVTARVGQDRPAPRTISETS